MTGSAARRRLEAWFWASSFQLVDPDVAELELWLQDGSRVPNVVESALTYVRSSAFLEQFIAKRTGRSGTRIDWRYQMLEARLSASDARDLFTGEAISVRRLFSLDDEDHQSVGVQVHHLVPLKWAERLHPELQRRCGGLANLSPLAPFTNAALIGDDAPADYLRALEKAGAANVDRLLEDHLVDPELLRALQSGCAELEVRVSQFLDDRRDRIIGAFEAVLSGGIPQPGPSMSIP